MTERPEQDPGQPLNGLEEALAATQRGERTTTDFIQMMTQSVLFVLLSKPWDGRSAIDPDTRMLLVSDGPDEDQPMLAMFTDPSRAHAYAEQAPGFSVTAMPAMMIFLGVAEGHGVIVNPNAPLTMKMKPPAAKILRGAAEEVLAKARETRPAPQPAAFRIDPDD